MKPSVMDLAVAASFHLLSPQEEIKEHKSLSIFDLLSFSAFLSVSNSELPRDFFASHLYAGS